MSGKMENMNLLKIVAGIELQLYLGNGFVFLVDHVVTLIGLLAGREMES